MFAPLVSSPSAMDDDEIGAGAAGGGGADGTGRARSAATKGQYVQMNEADAEDDEHGANMAAAGGSSSSATSAQSASTGLELPSLRSGGSGGSRLRGSRSDSSDGGLSGSLISSEHPSEAIHLSQRHAEVSVAAIVPSGSAAARFDGLLGAGRQTLEVMSQRLRLMLMEDASETAEEEIEMMDYDNPEDHVLERKLDEDHHSAAGGYASSGSGGGGGGASGLGSAGLRQSGSRMGRWGAAFARNITGRNWRKLKLTFLRMFITVIIGVCIGLTGFAVSKSVNAMIRANVHLLNSMMNADRPAAAFFTILTLACIYTAVASLFVTFGSWQTRGSGVGRLNAYLSGMSSSKFLALKTLFVKIGGLILTVSAGIKQGMEGPFIHIGSMIGLHVSRLFIWVCNLIGGRCGIQKYTSIVAGVVDERMFISSGAAAGFSVAFNAPIAGVLYVQDGAFAYWQGEYTLRTFLCTMTAVTTINMCFKQGEELPSRGLIDIDFARTTIVLQEFWGFFILGILGGVMGILFTKLNVQIEKYRQKYLQKARLPNVLDVLACTVLTVLLSFILPFMLGCHSRWAEDSCDNPDRCLQFQCGPQRYSDLATFFFTLPEETIRILFDRKTSVEAAIPYQTLIVFCIFYFLMAAISYGMAVPGGLFIPSIIIGASYGRLVGLAVQYILTHNTPAGETPPLIIPGVYAVLGSASMLGGITRTTLPITVMLIEITSDAQFLIPIMLVVLLAKVVADFGGPGLYAEHLKLDGLVMVFGDKPPSNLKKLTAVDVMSKHTLSKLDVVERVEEAWAAVRDTRHNAFPVTDSTLATLKSIIQKRRQSIGGHAASNGNGARKRTNAAAAKRANEEEMKQPYDSALGASASSSSSVAAASSSSPNPSAAGTGVFLGLIQRRHLIYVLTSMPCFPTAEAARDSEPMTALPYELQLAQYNAQQQQQQQLSRRNRAGSVGSSASPESPNHGSGSSHSSSNGGGSGSGVGAEALEVVPLTGSVHSPRSVLSTSPSSPSGLGLIVSTSPPPAPPSDSSNVSHALMHASADRNPLLNQDGASASASFVEWCARQANNVGQDMNKVAAGDLSGVGSGSAMPVAAAVTPSSMRGASHTPLHAISPSPSHEALSLSLQQRPPGATLLDVHSSSPRSMASLTPTPTAMATPTATARQSSGASGFSSGSSSSAHEPQPLGADLLVHSSLLSHYVNLSPFIDQGAYTVSENTSARRVWGLFRSLGMRHIVVLNHQHQPVGVITRRDLIRLAVAQ